MNSPRPRFDSRMVTIPLSILAVCLSCLGIALAVYNSDHPTLPPSNPGRTVAEPIQPVAEDWNNRDYCWAIVSHLWSPRQSDCLDFWGEEYRVELGRWCPSYDIRKNIEYIELCSDYEERTGRDRDGG